MKLKGRNIFAFHWSNRVGDHDSLYIDPYENRNKLRTYSEYFPIVEVDSSFYAMQPARNYTKWAMETPKDFSFIVKAYQGMTGHMKGEIPFLRSMRCLMYINNLFFL